MSLREAERFIRRPWTRAERRVVWHGLFGRLAIAIEPVLGAFAFAGIAIGVMLRVNRAMMDRVVIASIFILGFIGFVIYAICLLVNPIKAVLQIRRPIYIIDGYVRYRTPDDESAPGSTGYIGVMDESRDLICEWPAFGNRVLRADMIAALVEFSTYGGIHKIDGRSTGAIPEEFTALGIGLGAAMGRRR